MRTAILVVLFAALGFSAKPQNKPAANEPLVLDGADHFVVQNRGAFVELTGNVKFHRGDVKFTSRQAIWDRSIDQVRFEGDFRLEHPSGHLTSASGRYERTSGSAWAEGNARLVDSSGSVSLEAGTIRYDRHARTAEATRSPIFRRTGKNSADTGSGVALDTTEIRGESLVWRERDSVAQARGKVQIRRGDLRATCDTATLDQKSKKLRLEGTPRAALAQKTLSGKSIVLDVDMRRERIDRVLVLQDARGEVVGDADSAGLIQTARVFGDTLLAELEGDAFRSLLVTRKARGTSFSNRDTTRTDEMWGDTLRLEFSAGKMSLAQVRGHARSIYHHREKNADKGRNEARGKNIRIAFDNGRIGKIRIDGNAKGTFYGTERTKVD
ncbi:MAG: hypothetical protein IPN71_00905 [Fibrobacteres bacterium]|nr:hypothetical protein [Fibrobacterota bacterium]